MTPDPRDVLAAALVKANGYMPDEARRYVDRAMGSAGAGQGPPARTRQRLEESGPSAREADQLMSAHESRISADSGHGAYRIVADKVEALMSAWSFGGLWDGDASGEGVLCRFLDWLPDLVRHQAAADIRTEAEDWDGWPDRRAVLRREADRVDPFQRCDEDGCDRAPHWIRKGDHEADVPPGALTAEDLER